MESAAIVFYFKDAESSFSSGADHDPALPVQRFKTMPDGIFCKGLQKELWDLHRQHRFINLILHSKPAFIPLFHDLQVVFCIGKIHGKRYGETSCPEGIFDDPAQGRDGFAQLIISVLYQIQAAS